MMPAGGHASHSGQASSSDQAAEEEPRTDSAAGPSPGGQVFVYGRGDTPTPRPIPLRRVSGQLRRSDLIQRRSEEPSIFYISEVADGVRVLHTRRPFAEGEFIGELWGQLVSKERADAILGRKNEWHYYGVYEVFVPQMAAFAIQPSPRCCMAFMTCAYGEDRFTCNTVDQILCDDYGELHVCFLARRPILSGEELRWQYPDVLMQIPWAEINVVRRATGRKAENYEEWVNFVRMWNYYLEFPPHGRSYTRAETAAMLAYVNLPSDYLTQSRERLQRWKSFSHYRRMTDPLWLQRLSGRQQLTFSMENEAANTLAQMPKPE